MLGHCTVNRKRAGVSVPTGYVGDNNMKIIHYSADQLLLTGPVLHGNNEAGRFNMMF